MFCHTNTIVDIVSARSSSEALAYVFLPDGTSETEQRWTFAETAKNSRAFAAHLAGLRPSPTRRAFGRVGVWGLRPVGPDQ